MAGGGAPEGVARLELPFLPREVLDDVGAGVAKSDEALLDLEARLDLVEGFLRPE